MINAVIVHVKHYFICPVTRLIRTLPVLSLRGGLYSVVRRQRGRDDKTQPSKARGNSNFIFTNNGRSVGFRRPAARHVSLGSLWPPAKRPRRLWRFPLRSGDWRPDGSDRGNDFIVEVLASKRSESPAVPLNRGYLPSQRLYPLGFKFPVTRLIRS